MTNMLKKLTSVVFLLVFTMVVNGCAAKQETKSQAELDRSKDTVFQVSAINALLQGVYDGEITCGELKKQGDLGIGTLDGLDGEMVALDGQIYQVKSDGQAYVVGDEVSCPFAALTFFEKDGSRELKELASYDNLQKSIDSMIVNPNLFYAVRIDGTFDYVKTRSVPKQSKPYRPLAEVTASQPVFEFNNVKGTLVGFWCPKYIEGINVPGWHLHFLTADRKQGGHLLDCRLQEGTALVDESADIHLALLKGSDFSQADLRTDRQKELEKVEK